MAGADEGRATAPQAEPRTGFGTTTRAVCEVVYPESADDVRAAFALARERGWSVALWGNGRSYGDAALNDGQLLLDFGRMARILSWNPSTGVIVAQPGLTLGGLWRHVLEDGWWPPVVSGTMHTTLGGCAAANVHGKNNWKHGPFGEHVLAFTLLTPDGEEREVTRASDPDLFHAAIGGMGWLGVFTSLTLRLKKMHSGRLEVRATHEADLDGMFEGFEHARRQGYDYVVGWIDGLARGAAFGRGQIHTARYLDEGEDPQGHEMLALRHQELPSTFFGVIPKGWLWRFMKPFTNRWGMRLVNFARVLFGRWVKGEHSVLQTHANFNFLLDYVPDWKRVYEPGGFIQYQFFLPVARAREVFGRALLLAQREKLEPFLVVMKRHRADPFWLSHAVDGYSFACDFPVTERNRGDLHRLTRAFDKLVVEAGGRFYLAKDSVVGGASLRASLGDTILRRFLALKHKVDPDQLLQSNQFRRILGPVLDALPGWPALEGALDEPLPETLERLAAERTPAPVASREGPT